MTGFWIVLMWIGSLLLGTYLGYERGRWETGLVLGLLLGPLGALAAGMLLPSFECEAMRRYVLDQHIKRVHRAETAKLKEKREEAHSLAEMVNALEEQMEGQRNPLADGLDNLAAKLEEIAKHDPSQELLLRSWIGWLNRQSISARGDETGIAPIPGRQRSA